MVYEFDGLQYSNDKKMNVRYGNITKECYGKHCGTSLVVQWLRTHLPMQGTQVRALVREDPTCRGATKPMHHNY